MKRNNLRKKIFDIIQIGDKSNLLSRAFDIFIVIVILSNITVLLLQTFSGLAHLDPFFRAVEALTTVIFCLEYALRIWTADLLYPREQYWKSVLRFLVSFDGIVDLFTILPAFFLSGFVAFRMLRVVRIFHLFRLNAQYDSFHVITKVLLGKKNQLISSLFIIAVLMLASSLCMYSAEHEAQPEVFANAFSGLWWSMSTLLTVGYGDIYPITVTGQCMAICIAFLGVGAVAIPTGIISAGFVSQYQEDSRSRDYSLPKTTEIRTIPAEPALVGRKVEEITASEGLRIYLVLRGQLSLLPSPELVIRKGDLVLTRIPEDTV